MVYGPYTREQADKVTKDFTGLMRDLIDKANNGRVSEVYASGNTMPGETGFCFDVEDGNHTFCVEVFGPLVEADDAP